MKSLQPIQEVILIVAVEVDLTANQRLDLYVAGSQLLPDQQVHLDLPRALIKVHHKYLFCINFSLLTS